ncbi:MAG: ATP-binding protein [Paracoccaceae bacterium]|nr:ATP-binding protein [Paracoccaceae bacterium]
MRFVRGLSFLLVSLAFVLSVWWIGLGQALDQLAARGRTDLELASDRLVRQLSRYRELIVVLAGDPELQKQSTPQTEVRERLLRAADLSGALDLILIDKTRQPVASASDLPAGAWIGESFIDRALTGASGNFHGISETFDTRAFYFSAPLFSPEGPVEAVLVAIVDMDELEAEGRGETPAVLFTDTLGVTFSSNRSELVLMQRGANLRNTSARYEAADLRDFVDVRESQVAGQTMWRIDAGPYVPDRALHIAKDLPVLDLRAEALVDARSAYVVAGLQASVTAALFAFFGAVLFLATERRRALTRANAILESRVEQRTAELSHINAALRTEIGERKEAESALKQAQDELVQVGKLSALGQMSAGISHELNQPLMAIRSFAENGERFLDRGDMAKTKGNLAKISDLAGRMARIIKNLKAFARQESEPAARVDLVEVVRAALEVTEPLVTREGVAATATLSNEPVWVEGGEVRLQQVVVNLVSNAVDAMSASAKKRLIVQVTATPEPMVTVQDSGPGIADPQRIFEPFYSTKTVGEGEGTGLGLSISYGLVQSFGGNISGANAPEGGAVFTVRLKPWTAEIAA